MDNCDQMKPHGRSASIISNEDLVVIAASPLAPLATPTDALLSSGGNDKTTKISSSTANAMLEAAGGRRHRNGANANKRVSTPSSLPLTLVGTSSSQLSIQTASPVSTNSDRIVLNSNGPTIGDIEEQQTCSGPPKFEVIRRRCCSIQVRKMACGLLVTAAMASSWVGATHFIKRSYIFRREVALRTNVTIIDGYPVHQINSTLGVIYHRGSASATRNLKTAVYYAPFFTTWFCTTWISIFFPLYLCLRTVYRRDKTTFKSIYKEGVRNFRDRGFTMSKFFGRSAMLCGLFLASNYMYIQSLRVLDATDSMSLYSTSVAFVYLLSWVILHDQFVGVRIVAVILCSTGIALLAYMDGLTKTPTLGGVMMAATASAFSAVFRVLFKKLIGPANFNQVALFFTVISLFNTICMWPIALLLYLTGLEVIQIPLIPWLELLAGASLSLATNLLGNFGIAVTYEVFVTLAVIVAVPLSAAVDIEYNRVTFVGMKLSGNILIACGFMLVLFPNNWPDLLTKLIRLRRHHHVEEPLGQDACGGRSRLRSANGLIR